MTGSTQSILIHATCIAIDGRAVLLRGPPGAGKSDLALRLIYARETIGQVVQLLSDDQVTLSLENGALIARPPAAIAGRLEVRGVGIINLDHASAARLGLVIDLVEPARVERLPDVAPRASRLVAYFGVEVPRLDLTPFEASAPIKVLLALANVRSNFDQA